MKRLIVGLLFAILVAVFALQNNRPFAIRFLFWTFPRLSEALVIIGSVLLGAALGAVAAALRNRVIGSSQTTRTIAPPPIDPDPVKDE